ncbi:MAG: hypothetical protein HC771_23770 [Synechococcales cyanobacterium CRU_2_2]|nr:hypothetical protein [Synechococcales cyanobacterium CRU_2_2]
MPAKSGDRVRPFDDGIGRNGDAFFDLNYRRNTPRQIECGHSSGSRHKRCA